MEKVKDRLYDGAQVRVGGYVLTVVEIDTMEKVTRGKGWRFKAPLHVEDVDGEEDEED